MGFAGGAAGGAGLDRDNTFNDTDCGLRILQQGAADVFCAEIASGNNQSWFRAKIEGEANDVFQVFLDGSGPAILMGPGGSTSPSIFAQFIVFQLWVTAGTYQSRANSIVSTTFFQGRLTSDSNERISLNSTGIDLGDGSGSPDVSLRRHSNGQLVVGDATANSVGIVRANEIILSDDGTPGSAGDGFIELGTGGNAQTVSMRGADGTPTGDVVQRWRSVELAVSKDFTSVVTVLNEDTSSAIDVSNIGSHLLLQKRTADSAGLWLAFNGKVELNTLGDPDDFVPTGTPVGMAVYRARIELDLGNQTNVTGGLAFFFADQDTHSGTSWTASNVYGFYFRDQAAPSGGAITNLYGLYIEEPTRGDTLNQAIHVDGGVSYFGGDIEMAGTVIKANGATEIGVQVTNASLTVGGLGSMVVPVKTTTGAPVDSDFGDLDGAFGYNSQDDTLEVRDGADTFLSVGVAGYVIQRRVPARSGYWYHDSQFIGGGKDYVDERRCVVCGQSMDMGDVISMYANGRVRGDDLHAVFGHSHIERQDAFRQLVARVAELEAILAHKEGSK